MVFAFWYIMFWDPDMKQKCAKCKYHNQIPESTQGLKMLAEKLQIAPEHAWDFSLEKQPRNLHGSCLGWQSGGPSGLGCKGRGEGRGWGMVDGA